MLPHSLLSYSKIRGQFLGNPQGMSSRAQEKVGCCCGTSPQAAPSPRQFPLSARGSSDKAMTDFFPLLTCGYACQKANHEDRHCIGDCEAAFLCHLGGAWPVPVEEREGHSAAAAAGARRGAPCCHQAPWGEPSPTPGQGHWG